jgi:hydroxyethylthiazole kinase
MIDAIRSAQQFAKPCVLDLVGAKIKKGRTLCYAYLTKLVPSVIRGNASVIRAVVRALARSQEELGADTVENTTAAARTLARASKSVVIISDHNRITDGYRVILVQNGMNLVDAISDTCRVLPAMIAAFVAVDPH